MLLPFLIPTSFADRAHAQQQEDYYFSTTDKTAADVLLLKVIHRDQNSEVFIF